MQLSVSSTVSRFNCNPDFFLSFNNRGIASGRAITLIVPWPFSYAVNKHTSVVIGTAEDKCVAV